MRGPLPANGRAPMAPRPVGGGVVPGEDKDNPFGRDPEAGPPAPDGKVAPEGGSPADAGRPANLLFRFFDYHVAPGKHYVYRVQLALRNPNYKFKPVSQLKSPDLADKLYLTTTWSDPTSVISVPGSVPSVT